MQPFTLLESNLRDFHPLLSELVHGRSAVDAFYLLGCGTFQLIFANRAGSQAESMAKEAGGR